MATIDAYAVLGNPIGHSKSPEIHTLFAKQTAQALVYTADLVALDGFQQYVKQFQADGGCGLNITVPFKQEAWAVVDQRNDLAELAGAVNTIMFKNGQLLGFNTDGLGLVKDLIENCHIPLAEQRVLLLGAGGATRGVVLPLFQAGVKSMTIANRTAQKAEALATLFSEYGDVNGVGLDAICGSFDVVINATAAGLNRDVPQIDPTFVKNALCYDMMYGDKPTAFVEWANSHGATRAFDGLGMLVEQAAEAFLIWRGVRPKTDEVIAHCRTQL
ncbi:MAG: shikimate dehydrogenase [Methylococcales bacterium]|jgi:shikimate dehydrogenase|nr:shikimate dehydrogenase [Methylococcales bacterium]MBT7445062.1 shikimate dehydrogenase [Methylococcales bacterium]